MIDWSKISKEEIRLTMKIINRAKEIRSDLDKAKALMDLQACHISCPLDLERMLEGADFMHDIGGIQAHINRETGELEDCFHPRYAKEQ